MKIVINACHGGFNLSREAIKYIADKTGQQVYWFETKFDKDFGSINYVPIADEKALAESKTWCFTRAYKVPNPNELSDEQRREAAWDLDKMPRTDALLVEVVEVLGEKASGDFADLKVVEVPDDVQWHIAEYDGTEWVAENHRKWY